MTERAGYEIRTLEPGPASRCGGCGAEILPGEEYGYMVTTGMMICSECIEVFEQSAHGIQQEATEEYELSIVASGYDVSCGCGYSAHGIQIDKMDREFMCPGCGKGYNFDASDVSHALLNGICLYAILRRSNHDNRRN